MLETAATTRTTTRPTARRPGQAEDSYDNIEPWFAELAALDEHDPCRRALREHIIGLCLPLADHIARRFSGRGEAFDDLHQTARLGLVQAVDRFDVRRGSSFLAFAVPTIMGEVRRHFRDHTWALRVPRRAKELQAMIGPATEKLSQRHGRMPTAREIAAELDVELVEVTRALVAANAYSTNTLHAVGRDDDGNVGLSIGDSLGTEEPCYRLMEDAMAVRPLIAALPERERQVLIWRFYDSLTQSQIAERLGVSQMQVSRILNRTLTRLREEALAEPTAAVA
ncbi:RNA polymerase sigma factor SigF [Nocardia farcinica]|uniref:RNA polymerase sigma factor SigF n=1 Tax=Nocardia farcinica TaxID=37329 RepID=UPI00189628E0|nr:RNA polymerase sigma factor SigF [Nocardia farcinica]MBF6291620.1 RNA polymerase sigma factor SigF [Nocardia farcinica]MBF6373293.1 RNA polymerase sigma factor SigF [Nocardia farcinica]MBF6378089.1 RNA polymerase sigma factor SigF [Nocardia farcinica]